MLGKLAFFPRPKGLGGFICIDGKLNTDVGRTLGAVAELAVFAGLRVVSGKILDGVLHPAALVEIADEQVVTGAVLDMPCFGLGQLHRGEAAPVAGGGGQRTQGACGKGALVVAAHVCDGVGGAVVTLHDVANFQI